MCDKGDAVMEVDVNYFVFDPQRTTINGAVVSHYKSPKLIFNETEYRKVSDFINNEGCAIGLRYFWAYIGDYENGFTPVLIVPQEHLIMRGEYHRNVLHGYTAVSKHKTELRYSINIAKNQEGNKYFILSWNHEIEHESSEESGTFDIETVVTYHELPTTSSFVLKINQCSWPSEYILYKNDNIHGDSETPRHKLLHKKMKIGYKTWIDVFYVYDSARDIWDNIECVSRDEDQREKRFSLENRMEVIIRSGYREYNYAFLIHNGSCFELIQVPAYYTRVVEVEGGIKLE